MEEGRGSHVEVHPANKSKPSSRKAKLRDQKERSGERQ